MFLNAEFLESRRFLSASVDIHPSLESLYSSFVNNTPFDAAAAGLTVIDGAVAVELSPWSDDGLAALAANAEILNLRGVDTTSTMIRGFLPVGSIAELHGLSGLRVADAVIKATQPSGVSNLPVEQDRPVPIRLIAPDDLSASSGRDTPVPVRLIAPDDVPLAPGRDTPVPVRLIAPDGVPLSPGRDTPVPVRLIAPDDVLSTPLESERIFSGVFGTSVLD